MSKILPVEKALLYKLFAYMQKGGVTPIIALRELAEEAFSPEIQKQLKALVQKLPETASLSLILHHAPFNLDGETQRLFDNVESAEHRKELLLAVADRYSQNEIVNQICDRQALSIWPITIIIAAGVFWLLMDKVFPAFEMFFDDTVGVEALPFATRFMIDYGWAVLSVFLIIAIIAFLLSTGKVDGVKEFDKLKLHGPWGSRYRKAALAKYVRMLSILHPRSLAADEKLALAIASMENASLAKKMTGQTAQYLAAPLSISKDIPETFSATLRIAERIDVGNEIYPELMLMADSFLAARLYSLQSMLDTLLKLLTALFCGWLVISIYMPIFQMGGAAV